MVQRKRHYRKKDPFQKYLGVSLPKLVKRIGFGAGAYLGAFAPSQNANPQNALELLKTNPQWAADDLVASVVGYNGNSHEWSVNELYYFWGPVVATQIIGYLMK